MMLEIARECCPEIVFELEKAMRLAESRSKQNTICYGCYFPNSLLIRSTTSGGVLLSSLAIDSISSHLVGSISSLRFSASASKLLQPDSSSTYSIVAKRVVRCFDLSSI
jgi:hypothetical protein